MLNVTESPLAISWHDTTRIPQLNPSNILDYFCNQCNPFYEKTCNNELLRMQNRDLEQLSQMKGTEYIVLHVQEPILYVIRKQQRLSPVQITPLADYYILAGTVYQAPDLQSVVNSRLTTCVHNLSSAFDETISLMKYHPTKGYSWRHNDSAAITESGKEKEKVRMDMGSSFQRRRVELLLTRIAEQAAKNSKVKTA